MSATERSRRYRERRREGLILVEAEVDAELLVEVLTGAGLLDEWDESRQSIAEAFGAAVRLWIAQELAKR